MHILTTVRQFITTKTATLGVQETNFPLLISSASLEKEKEHIQGFAPELAWVTKAGLNDLSVPEGERVSHYFDKHGKFVGFKRLFDFE